MSAKPPMVPALRDELEFHEFEDDGRSMVLVRDPLGYVTEMLAFSPQGLAVLAHCDGAHTLDAIHQAAENVLHGTLDVAHVRAIVEALDTHLYLDSPRFRAARAERDRAWAESDVRPAAHAGASYPEDPAELRAFLDGLFATDTQAPLPGRLAGVLAPHIDLGIGPDVYVPAFRQLATSTFDTVVILGTSHYSGEDLFLLTDKDYETPLGRARTDRAFLEALREGGGAIFSRDDTAHRPEHAIEFPVLFLQHLFGADVRILPVLVTSFEGFLSAGIRAAQVERYRAFLDGFAHAVAATGRRCAFVLSVDWSHIGRKFGDDADAADMLERVRASDHAHFAALERCDAAAFDALLRATGNATRIDGHACLTTFFDLARPSRGALLRYDQWHEEERASAVSYASMAFFHEDGTDA